MAQPTFRRRKKLIKPKLQLQLIGSVGGVAVLAMLMQLLMIGYFLTSALSELENGDQLVSQVPGALVTVLVMSMMVLVPVFLVLGVALTFRYAGPVYRFEQYLAAIARGEKLGPCVIRRGDHLQSLCDAINLATEPLRQAAGDENDEKENQAKSEDQAERAAA